MKGRARRKPPFIWWRTLVNVLRFSIDHSRASKWSKNRVKGNYRMKGADACEERTERRQRRTARHFTRFNQLRIGRKKKGAHMCDLDWSYWVLFTHCRTGRVNNTLSCASTGERERKTRRSSVRTHFLFLYFFTTSTESDRQSTDWATKLWENQRNNVVMCGRKIHACFKFKQR